LLSASLSPHMAQTVIDYVKHLGLLPHPEGGYYKELYRSAESFVPQGFDGPRAYCTAIYFLIEKDNFSALHRIKSDETWHFYAGDALEVMEIDSQGNLKATLVGPELAAGEVFQYTVAAGNWFGSRVKSGGGFSLVGCTVSPGFDFNDCEMAEREALTRDFPQHADLIREMTR
jgi:predicted cupin superfamily sugar epimerase